MKHNLKIIVADKFIYTKNDKIFNSIDTTIYAEHWFRLPSQSKNSDKTTIHEIKKGNMLDFIPDYIHFNSVNIDSKQLIMDKRVNVNKEEKLRPYKKKKDIDIDVEKIIQMNLCENKKRYVEYKQLFDNCYKQNRYDDYGEWIKVGMALRNIYGDDSFQLFDYFSSKSTKYEGTEKTFVKFKSFAMNDMQCYNVGTLYNMAKEDNINEYKKIMYVDTPSFLENDFAKKIFELAGDNFIYVKGDKENCQIYCYNGKYWETNSFPLRKYISNELHEYYENLMKDVYWNTPNFRQLKTQIDRLKLLNTKKNIVDTYKEIGMKNITFDNKWWLLGFNNGVYDLTTYTFRNYVKTDYVSITTGYDWIEPTTDQLNTMKQIINHIMPISSERDLYLSILSTGLEGRCLEKFIVFCGNGRNGKGLIDDLYLHALGDYGFSANNSLLFTKSTMGSNPEKANLNKKRFVIFREPPEKSKFENSAVKELTGGGKLSTRSHYETDTQKKLHCTVVCECNKRPLFSEEPTNAEVNRLIDILFRSTFTMEKEDLDENKYIFECKIEYKDDQFQDDHRTALLKILFDSHKNYSDNKFKFDIPQFIKNRTDSYLELSCVLLQWFKENYELTSDNSDNVKIDYIHKDFKASEYYMNLTKAERRTYNLTYFIGYFSNNIITKKYYKKKLQIHNTCIRNVLCNWKEIPVKFKGNQCEFIDDNDEKPNSNESMKHLLDY